MKLKVLVDNNTYIDEYYLGEPGVSFYIETVGAKILFDTGYSDIFIKNAEKMGVDLNFVTHIVLSHGHLDHTNGLKYLLEKTDLKNVEIICHPSCFNPKTKGALYIGAPMNEDEISAAAKYAPSKTPRFITPDCVFLGEIPRVNGFENKTPIGRKNEFGCWSDDYLLDDSALAFKTENGIFIVTGCSHSGICNIVSYAKEILGCDKIAGIIGGFHLLEDDVRLDSTIEYLKDLKADKLYPCHCVCLKAKAKMINSMKIEEVGVGMEINV
ncbi:MBL fold metallo-hydrolase [Anaerotignum faecicola]|nr:MBL fold metallo-hydrolase [Anaerotignum faecicola]